MHLIQCFSLHLNKGYNVVKNDAEKSTSHDYGNETSHIKGLKLSQNHRMICIGKDLKDHFVSIPLK